MLVSAGVLKGDTLSSPSSGSFFAAPFPRSPVHFVRSNRIELCISNVLVDWSLERVLARGGGNSQASFFEVVEDCLYAIVAIRSNLDQLQETIGTSCIILHYEGLINEPFLMYERVLEFLQMQSNPIIFERVKNVLASVTGATLNRQASKHYLLNEKNIRSTCASLLSDIVRKIREEGIHRARVMGIGEKGRFSFLSRRPVGI